MLPRRVTAVLLIALAAALAPAAHADHDTATATIDGTLGAPRKDGSRVHTITFTTACSDPEADVDWVVSRKLIPKNSDAKPAYVGHVQRRRSLPGTITVKMLVAPGTRWVPALHAECVANGEGHHSAEVDVEGPRELYLPPRIHAWRFSFSERCGYRSGADRKFQVGMPSQLVLDTHYDWFPMLRRKKGGPVLRIVGGGLDLRIDTRGDLYGIYLPKKFKRSGRARVWLDFAGERSNVLKIPILPLPSGCGR